jgi:hypothetical protein
MEHIEIAESNEDYEKYSSRNFLWRYDDISGSFATRERKDRTVARAPSEPLARGAGRSVSIRLERLHQFADRAVSLQRMA